MVDGTVIEASNRAAADAHRRGLDGLGEQLARRGVEIGAVIERVGAFEVAVPSWALGTGATRFGRFPGEGEPRDVFEKLDDIAVIHCLTGATPRVSLHIPWDEPDDPPALRSHAASRGLGFDAVNSNTFQDQSGQALSYKFGSLAHANGAVRRQAIEHIRRVIDVGSSLGSSTIAIWLADGSNYPGQANLRNSFERVSDGLANVYEGMPADWTMLVEHKAYEPAFYATVVADWGSSLMLAQAIGERAMCLVDLGHHLPNTNIEQVVARLVTAGKLGGFHFNDSKYGDDDLTAGSINPYQLFLVFNELADAVGDGALDAHPAYMIDQSHNVKDPIEALLQTVSNLQKAYARALLVQRGVLAQYQHANDVLMAEETLKSAFETDVSALVAEARRCRGGAIDPVATFRNSGYRRAKAEERTRSRHAPPQSL